MTIDEKGRRRKKYETYMTPYERLKSLGKKAARCLREGVSFAALDAIAAKRSDNKENGSKSYAKPSTTFRLIYG